MLCLSHGWSCQQHKHTGRAQTLRNITAQNALDSKSGECLRRLSRFVVVKSAFFFTSVNKASAACRCSFWGESIWEIMDANAFWSPSTACAIADAMLSRASQD